MYLLLPIHLIKFTTFTKLPKPQRKASFSPFICIKEMYYRLLSYCLLFLLFSFNLLLSMFNSFPTFILQKILRQSTKHKSYLPGSKQEMVEE